MSTSKGIVGVFALLTLAGCTAKEMPPPAVTSLLEAQILTNMQVAIVRSPFERDIGVPQDTDPFEFDSDTASLVLAVAIDQALIDAAVDSWRTSLSVDDPQRVGAANEELVSKYLEDGRRSFLLVAVPPSSEYWSYSFDDLNFGIYIASYPSNITEIAEVESCLPRPISAGSGTFSCFFTAPDVSTPNDPFYNVYVNGISWSFREGGEIYEGPSSNIAFRFETSSVKLLSMVNDNIQTERLIDLYVPNQRGIISASLGGELADFAIGVAIELIKGLLLKGIR